MLYRSHIVSDMRGSVAGITYSRNHYGLTGRARIKPVDVNSNPLENQRSLLNSSVAHWKFLAPAERLAWTDFAKGTPWLNKLGETVYLTGQAMYIGQVTAAMSVMGATARPNYINAPCVPGMFTTPLLNFRCCDNPDIGVIVSIENQHPTNLMNVVVYRSPPQSPGVKFYRGPWDTAARLYLVNIAPDSSDDAEFCDLCEAKYFFKVRCFDGTDQNNMSTLIYGSFVACTTAP